MHGTTLSFSNLHNHGELFANIHRARRESSVVQNQWSPPETLGRDYDQYDTPQSRWVAVHHTDGQVLAGVRLTPTTACCGVYSYMIRDAQNGLLDSVPTDLLFDKAPVSEGTWEITRGFVAAGLSADTRHKVRAQLVMQMLRTSREEGIRTMLALLPAQWDRWGDRFQLDMKAAGRNMNMSGNDCQAVWIDFSTQLH